MKLDFIDDINEYGDNIVRLYEFDKAEAIAFRALLFDKVITNKEQVDLSTIDFIERRNCNLTIRIAESDEGITSENKVDFFCDLTITGYQNMLKLIDPFCNRETKGFQMLYDIDSLTDFVFSPGGTW